VFVKGGEEGKGRDGKGMEWNGMEVFKKYPVGN